MVALSRIQVSWEGISGGSGVSTFYSTGGTEPCPQLVTFFTSLSAILPSQVRIVVPGQGDVIEDTSGDLMGTWSTGAGGSIQGQGSAVFAAPVGTMIRWLTSGIVAGHRVRGRTFLVPLSGLAYATDGTMVDASRVAVQGMVDTLHGDTTTLLQIWSRPAKARVKNGVTIPAHDGSSYSILGGVVPDKLVVLRSRRD